MENETEESGENKDQTKMGRLKKLTERPLNFLKGLPYEKVGRPVHLATTRISKAVEPALPILGLLSSQWKGLGYATTGLTVIGTASRMTERYKHAPVAVQRDAEDFTHFNGIYVDLVKKHGVRLPINMDSINDDYIQFGPVTIKVQSIGSGNSILVVKDRDLEVFYATLRDAIWNSAESTQTVLKGDYDLRKDSDIPEDLIYTEFAQYLERRMLPFVRKTRRSFLLTGLPGEGKTTVTRMIARKNGWRTIRINERTMDDPDRLESAALVFTPDVIIMDDIDRLHDNTLTKLLEIVEHLGASMLVATVNRIGNLDRALTRPGRFDEIISAHGFTPSEVSTLINGKPVPEDKLKIISDWPVAFVNEFVTRLNAFGLDDAIKEIDTLEARVNDLRKEYGINSEHEDY